MIPVIECEYGESRRAGDPHSNFMMLVAVDTSTAMPNAVGVRSKGPTDKYAIEGIDLIHSRFGVHIIQFAI